MKYLDFFFGWCKPYRFIRGGRWSRLNSKAEAGATWWLRNHQPIPGSREPMLRLGILDEETYQ